MKTETQTADRAVMPFGRSSVHAAFKSTWAGHSVLACDGRTVMAMRVDDGNPGADVAGVAGCKRCRQALKSGRVVWAGTVVTDAAAPCAPTVPTDDIFEDVFADLIRRTPLTVESVEPLPACDLPADELEEWSDEDDTARAEWEAEQEAALNAEHQETHTAEQRDVLHGDMTPHVREYLARLLHGPKRTLALALYASRVLPLDSFTDPGDVVGVTDEMRRNVEKSLGRAMRKDGHKVGAYSF
jgi:hypothetical protein